MPWQDLDDFCARHPQPLLAHVVQSRAKLGALPMVSDIKKFTYVVSLRRRDKVRQFASWIYFKNIGAIYNFDHRGMDYVAPGTYRVSYDDIEQFVIDQIIDNHYVPDTVLYYEDLDLKSSNIEKNHYEFDPRLMISNLDFVEHYLGNWRYNI